MWPRIFNGAPAFRHKHINFCYYPASLLEGDAEQPMSSTRVKICGITRVEDAVAASSAGADAIGLVFYEKSRRFISDLGLANDIAASVGPFVSVVALFVNPDRQTLERTLDQVPVDLVQFHGDENDDICYRCEKPYIKALRVDADADVEVMIERYPRARGILLDTYVRGIPGGTGKAFDWSKVPKRAAKAIILAGGLHRGNVREAIGATQPYAVDVSGGVEQTPGIKDHDKIKAFISQVKAEN